MKNLLVLLITTFSITATATSEVTHLRNDQTIPEHCQTNDISDFFSHDLQYITYSRTGAVRRGFTYEYDISRDELRRFWGIFKSESFDKQTMAWVNESPKRANSFNMIKENYKIMDFDFSEEGQVLEVLAVVAMKKELSSDQYITGSVAYSGGSNRIGELDIVIGDVETCKVSIVGEVKINPKRLGKARGQLSRFRRFLDSVN